MLALVVACTLISVTLAVIFLGLTANDRKILFSKKKKIVINGSQRTYLIFIPKKIEKPAKIILILHGYGNDARQIAYFSAFHNSTSRDTVVVYPDASKANRKEVRRGWNAGYCCGSGWSEGTDDAGFISALIDHLAEKYSIDPKRIFAAGYSNGGMMIHQLASEIPDKIAGFAAVSSSIGTEAGQARPKIPRPILLMQGRKDKVIPFAGGAGRTGPALKWLGFQSVVRTWENVNGCKKRNRSELSTNIENITYSTHKAPLEIYIFNTIKHQWPDWRLANFWHRQTLGSKIIINFFETLGTK